MNVKFDIEQEFAEKDDGLQVEVPSKTVIDIKQKLDFIKKEADKVEGNEKEVKMRDMKKRVLDMYDKKAKLLQKSKKSPGDKELSKEAALAREEYDVCKGHYKEITKPKEIKE